MLGVCFFSDLPHKPILEVYKYEASNPRHWILQGTCKTQANSTESIALVFRNGFRTFLHFIRPGTTEVEDAKIDDETFVNDDNLITYKVLSGKKCIFYHHFGWSFQFFFCVASSIIIILCLLSA